MIKNIIFDIGNVLAAFDWEGNLRKYNFSEEKYEEIANALYRSSDWEEMDRGVMTTEEVIARFCGKLPEYESEIRQIVADYSRIIHQYPYTKPMLRALKEKGYRLYYLSNYGKYGYEQTKTELDFIELMDGGLFSYEVKMIKPSKWIYMELLERYELRPEETVFFDDNAKNAKAAELAGITGIHFLSYEQAMEELEKISADS